ncbi:DUF4214 domain-containing protein [Tianweitania sediminis]|uniref:DUF4214 domain-containing protein n=1 Tax=Tianweitania sediminis TaxID=1502156 RepID=A0A8J7R4S1_9HYPH|nr:DUF4214 domain-containing protein [Tianweitania sediminis]MBP0441193.1 DUF4214 domain-containing protein [Tianweitania sediminis]
MDAIQTIYIALFGRPADPLGLAYFMDETNNGADLTSIGDLAATAEYQDRFSGMTNVQIITSIYQELFGRNPEAAGLTYFLAELESGRQNINTIAINIAQGAQGNDAAVLANKVEAANTFTAAIDTPDELAAYNGNNAAAAGRAFLDGVTADDATVPTAAEAQAAIDVLLSTPDSVITLTTETGEQISGTTGADQYNIIAGGPNATLNSFDTINDLGGVDTANIVVRGAGNLPAGASISGVEIINLDQSQALLNNGNDIDATFFQGATQIWQIGGAQDINNVSASVTAGFRNVEADAAVEFTGEMGAIALDNVGDDSDLVLDGEAVTNVMISGTVDDDGVGGAGTVTFTAGADLDALETLTLSLTSDAIVDVDGLLGDNDFTTIDASASTGDIELADLENTNNITSITTGSGNDDVHFDTDYTPGSAGGTAVTIDVGAGDDVVELQLYSATANSSVEVTLGSGSDLVLVTDQFENINTASAATLEAGLVTVTDFSVTEDTLDISDFGAIRTTIVNTDLTTIANQDTLFEAATLAGTFATGANDFVVFNYEGSAYVLYDGNDSSSFNAGDGLIELTGVTAAQLNAANFAF